jgi:hypothetical protein
VGRRGEIWPRTSRVAMPIPHPWIKTAEDAKGRRGNLAGAGNDSVIPAQAGIQFFLETTEGRD